MIENLGGSYASIKRTSAGRRTALDMLSASKLPVIASHSNYAAVHKHMRNLDDEILEGIKRVGGVVGFTMITSTIGDKPSLDSLARHIIEVWRRFGSIYSTHKYNEESLELIKAIASEKSFKTEVIGIYNMEIPAMFATHRKRIHRFPVSLLSISRKA